MANTVGPYKDGLGNLANAIHWDGDPGTLTNILAWTKRARIDHGRLGLLMQTNLVFVAINAWLVMDSTKFLQVFQMSNSQFTATYVANPPT